MNPDLYDAVLKAIPYAVGGLIGVMGSVLSGPLTHYLKARTERAQRRAEKLERLLDVSHQLFTLARGFDLSNADEQNKDWHECTKEANSLALLHLPELEKSVLRLTDRSSFCCTAKNKLYPGGHHVEDLPEGARAQWEKMEEDLLDAWFEVRDQAAVLAKRLRS